MRFSSILFPLPFVASAFAAPLAKPEPIAIASFDNLERDVAPVYDISLEKRDNPVVKALEEVLDGLVSLKENSVDGPS